VFAVQVKYKKHKKGPRANGQIKGEKPSGPVQPANQSPQLIQQMQPQQVSPAQPQTQPQPQSLAPHLVNGTILKTALTNPSEVRVSPTQSQLEVRAVTILHRLKFTDVKGTVKPKHPIWGM